MENTLTIRTNCNFENKDLNAATAAIAKCAGNLKANYNRICVILAQVYKKETYKKGGFENLKDYGVYIGIPENMVYKLKDAGMIFDSEDEVIKGFAKGLTATAANTLKSVKPEELKKAILDGELKSGSTVEELKAWKSKPKSKSTDNEGDAKVLKQYAVDTWVIDSKKYNHYDKIAIENIPEIEGYVKIGNFVASNKKVWSLYYHVDNNTFTAIHKESVKTSNTTRKGQREKQIQAMIASGLTREQAEAILALK